jgi:hypothetical protein
MNTQSTSNCRQQDGAQAQHNDVLHHLKVFAPAFVQGMRAGALTPVLRLLDYTLHKLLYNARPINAVSSADEHSDVAGDGRQSIERGKCRSEVADWRSATNKTAIRAGIEMRA